MNTPPSFEHLHSCERPCKSHFIQAVVFGCSSAAILRSDSKLLCPNKAPHVVVCSRVREAVTSLTSTAAFLRAIAVLSHCSLRHAAMHSAHAVAPKPKHGRGVVSDRALHGPTFSGPGPAWPESALLRPARARPGGSKDGPYPALALKVWARPDPTRPDPTRPGPARPGSIQPIIP